MIIIDIHESADLKDELAKQCLLKKIPLENKIESLKVGDFVFPDKNVVIEHKRFGDFVGSVMSGRMKEQIYQMRANYENVFLIISGEREEMGGVHPHSISGGMTSITAKYKVPILWATSDEDIAWQVISIYEKVDQPIKPFSEVNRLKSSDQSVKVCMLSNIPGIGEKRARLLLEEMNWDIRRIMDLTPQNIFDVKCMTEGMAFNLLKITQIKKEA